MLSHTLRFVGNVPHVLLHAIEVVKGIREEFEVALNVFDQVALYGLQVLGKCLIHTLYILLRGDLKNPRWQTETFGKVILGYSAQVRCRFFLFLG